MAPPIIYDPRHTTGVSPVHRDVKHPLIHDPRKPGDRRPLHKKQGAGAPIKALLIWLTILLILLAGAMWFVFGVLAG